MLSFFFFQNSCSCPFIHTLYLSWQLDVSFVARKLSKYSDVGRGKSRQNLSNRILFTGIGKKLNVGKVVLNGRSVHLLDYHEWFSCKVRGWMIYC